MERDQSPVRKLKKECEKLRSELAEFKEGKFCVDCVKVVHYIQCSSCNEKKCVRCNDVYIECENCKKFVCQRCREICQRCTETSCAKCLARNDKCRYCKKKYCGFCSSECRYCGAFCCSNQTCRLVHEVEHKRRYFISFFTLLRELPLLVSDEIACIYTKCYANFYRQKYDLCRVIERHEFQF
jgi:hypothetical protein